MRLPDKRFVQQYVIRDYDTSTSSVDSVASLSTQAQKSVGAAQQRKGSARRHATESEDALAAANNVEMTVSNHYDNLEEMGIPVPPSRRKTSLFDYGLKSD